MGPRLWAALKYTFFFIVIAGILLVTGLFMKPNEHEDVDLDWLRKILTNLGKCLHVFFFYLSPYSFFPLVVLVHDMVIDTYSQQHQETNAWTTVVVFLLFGPSDIFLTRLSLYL